MIRRLIAVAAVAAIVVALLGAIRFVDVPATPVAWAVPPTCTPSRTPTATRTPGGPTDTATPTPTDGPSPSPTPSSTPSPTCVAGGYVGGVSGAPEAASLPAASTNGDSADRGGWYLVGGVVAVFLVIGSAAWYKRRTP